MILGIDPGLAITGYGFVREDGNRLAAVAYGVVRTKAHVPVEQRLLRLYEGLLDLIRTYQPDQAAVEQLFFATNVRTAMSVSQARGVALLALGHEGVPIAEYTPLQIKQATTGYGKADKAQVQEMVRVLLSLDECPRPDDAADALAVAICHQNHARFAEIEKGTRGAQ